jgi:hypothetical protein
VDDPRISRANVAPANPSPEWVEAMRVLCGFDIGKPEIERRLIKLEEGRNED